MLRARRSTDSLLLRKLGPALVFGAAVVLASPPAMAQSAADKKAAAAEATKAQKAFGAKKWADAASGYESAYRKAPNPKFLIGAANARAKLGENVKAANLYAKAMKDGDAATKDEAKKGLSAVGPKLGQLEIKADGATSVSVDGDVVDMGVPLYFCQPGSRQVVAKYNDKESTLSPNVAAGVVTKVALTAPEAPAVAAKPTEEPKKDEPIAEKPKDTSSSSGGKPFSPLVVYVGAGLTVVGVGVTIWSGLDTQKQKDTFETDKSQENLDAGKSKQTRTNIFLGVTAAVGVFTAVAAIFFTDWNRKSTDANIKVGGGEKPGERQKPTVKFGAGPGSFEVYGTF